MYLVVDGSIDGGVCVCTWMMSCSNGSSDDQDVSFVEGKQCVIALLVTTEIVYPRRTAYNRMFRKDENQSST